MKKLFAVLFVAGLIVVSRFIGTCYAAKEEEKAITDLSGKISYVSQGWGNLGINTAVKSPTGDTPVKLQIRDEVYESGLGHHAAGEIVIKLDGKYSLFEAEVGVQWQGGGEEGSVVFQVYVDDEKRFDSGIMKQTDEAKPIRVSVEGASILRLVSTDAGDGIRNDAADWVNMKLVPSALPKEVNLKPESVKALDDPRISTETKPTSSGISGV